MNIDINKERAKKNFYITVLGSIFACSVIASVICPAIKQANVGVIFLKTTFPAMQVSDGSNTPVADDVEVINTEGDVFEEPEIIDNEARLITALQKDDIDVAYDKLEDKERWHVVRMRVTGYCSCRKCCGNFSDGKTACNHRIHNGDVFVAADKRFRFGTEMIVPGYNQTQPVKVLDRGRLIKGNRLDVYFDSHKDAQKWGVQYLDVLVKTQD